MKKITWTNIKDSPIATIAAIIITTAGITYAIINNLIVEQYILREEYYKLEIQRLEKIIDQKDKINNLDSIANSLRNLLETQTKVLEMRHLKNQNQINQKFSPNKWDVFVKDAISTGDSLLILDPTNNNTFELFNRWRRECIEFLNQFDTEFSTNYNDNFSTLTKLDRSDYQQLKTKINDGLSILKIIKNY